MCTWALGGMTIGMCATCGETIRDLSIRVPGGSDPFLEYPKCRKVYLQCQGRLERPVDALLINSSDADGRENALPLESSTNLQPI
jgi:hypothetical protein